MPRHAGFYIPGAVQILIGSPVGPLGAAVLIPGLPPGVTFPFIMSGRASDEFASADRSVDSVTMEVGIDGEGVYVVTFDRSGELTITVMESSFLNIALSLAHNALTSNNPLLFTLPVTFNDPFALNKKMTARSCVIKRPPPMTFSGTAGTNAWSLMSIDMEINHGARTF